MCVCVCTGALWWFPSWQHHPGIIHGTHPISHRACATYVFLFNLLVFSSSATTRTLPAIFFPARDKRITDVRGWNVPFPPPLSLPPPPHPPPALRLLRDNLCTLTLSSLTLFFFCFPEVCPSHVRYVGTQSCAHLPPAPHWINVRLIVSQSVSLCLCV